MTLAQILLLTIAALPLAAQTPEAYVPNKKPMNQTIHMPKNPLKSRPESVDMLVTIDPTGAVAKTEVLAGDPKFRDAALHEAKQWKFRPVMRNGKAVYAYTIASDVVWVDGEPDDRPSDMEGNMAMMTRMNALSHQFPRTPQQELEDLEQDRQPNSMTAGYELPQLAKAAVKAEAWDKAVDYATQLLKTGDGQAVHDGHMVLGLVALHQGNIVQAKTELISSGKTIGSPVLMSFGPNMTLAKALLDKGERDAVLEYFAECRVFWKMGAERLDQWTTAIKNGDYPNFQANLVY